MLEKKFWFFRFFKKNFISINNTKYWKSIKKLFIYWKKSIKLDVEKRMHIWRTTGKHLFEIALALSNKCLYNENMNTDIRNSNYTTQEKLQILADAAKYDVACTSSGLLLLRKKSVT